MKCCGGLMRVLGVCIVLVLGAALWWTPGGQQTVSKRKPPPSCHKPPCKDDDATSTSHLRPQVTVESMVLQESPHGLDKDTNSRNVAVLKMDEGQTSGNRSLSWSSTSHSPTTPLPPPVVTVASRLLYEDDLRGEDDLRSRRQDRERDRNLARVRNLARDRIQTQNRDRGRNLDRDRIQNQDRDRNRNMDQDRNPSQDLDRGRNQDRDRTRNPDRDRNPKQDRDRGNNQDRDRGRNMDRDRNTNRDRDGGRSQDRDNNQDRVRVRNQDPDRERSSLSSDPQPRELQYDAVPEGVPYRTDTTHAEPTLLAWAGSFVSILQPSHFPLELVRAALEQRISGEELVMESLSAEPGFVACMGVGACLAVLVPLVGVLLCCCRLCGRCGGSKTQHHHTSCFNFQRRTLTAMLSSISCFVVLGIVVAVVSNERLGTAVGAAQRSIHNNVRDLDTFLANTKMQLRYLVTNSFEQTAEAIHNDLNDIEYLLGRPLQRELAAEAQIEVALDSLLHISSSLRNIASSMRELEASRLQAAARAEELRGRLLELARDIQRFVSRCPPEDKKLCDSLDTRGLDLSARFDSFSFSEQLRLLGEVERQNLTQTARHARLEFENIPSYVEVMTRPVREDVKRVVQEFRGVLYTRIRGLDNVAFDLEVRTRDLTWRLDRAAAALHEHEDIRWYTGLGISVCLGFVWVLLTIGICCGCSSGGSHRPPTERSCVSHSAGKTLISSVFFMIVLSSVLWAVVVGLFVVGAHAHAFICHPLYEEPAFPTLTHLLDHSGMVYKNGPVLTNLLHPGRDVHLNMGQVLSLCKEGKTAYEVFQLRHYFDLEAETDHQTKLDLRGTLGHLRVNLSQVELLSPEAETHLNDFLRSIKIDLGPYRREMEKPLVEKSLPALVEQMQNVAGQLRSVAASAELFKMVARTRSLISNTLYPLEKRKEDVTYQVATLDMEVMPLQRQINQSAGHLRTIQYFIHNHGSSLAAAKARGYVERILGYTRQYTAHVRDSAYQHVAPCTPVWDLFDSGRGVTCNGIIEPLNALWLATSWCLLLFLPAICMGLGLARFYLRMDYDDDTLPLHSNGSPPGSNSSLQQTSGPTWCHKNTGGRHFSDHGNHNGNGHW